MIKLQIQIYTILIISANIVKCTISGLSYMDPLNFRPLPDKNKDDPCHPLYWYPRDVPEYCYWKSTPKPPSAPTANEPPDGVVPFPIPVPGPNYPPIMPPLPAPCPVPPPMPIPPYHLPQPLPPAIPPLAQPLPPPMPPLPQPMPPLMPAVPPPLPYGLPLLPSNPMVPVPGVPYPPPYPSYPQVGMVPGIKGLVSEDAGINILPFSDAYSDLLEKHKNKILRKRLRQLLGEYDRYPRRRRKHKRIKYIF